MFRKFFTLLLVIFIITSFFIVKKTEAATLLQKVRVNNLGLLGYWTLDGADTVWTSATAATTLDKSGRGNTGTLTNMEKATSPTIGKVGQGLRFDGTNDYINITGLNPTSYDNLTISGWFKSDANLGTDDFDMFSQNTLSDIVEFGSTDDGGQTDRLRFAHRVNNVTATTVYGLTDVVDTQWHHVVVVRNSGTILFYVDGVLDNTATDAQTGTMTISGNAVIGADAASPTTSNRAKGLIDDVRLYNRALSAAEIKQLYLIGTPSKVNIMVPTKSNSGLVGYWRFDGADTVWTSATAATTLDKSGNGYTGTVTNMAQAISPTAGKIGQGLRFDGVDDYIDINGLNPTTYNNFTISAWFKSDVSLGTDDFSIFGQFVSGNFFEFGSTDDGGQTDRLRFVHTILGVNATTVYGATDVVDMQWHHVIMVRNSGSILFYVDGVLDNTTTDTQTGSMFISGSGIIGADPAGPTTSNRTRGIIDEVRLYNRALQTSEIKQLYLQGGGVHANTQPATKYNNGLVGYWSFNGADTVWTSATAATTLDKSGNGNTGTLTNMTRASAPTIGKTGQGLLFGDTTTTVVSAGNTGTLTENSTITMSAWVYPTALTDNRSILAKNGNDGNGGPNLFISGTAGDIRLRHSKTITNAGATSNTTPLATLNKWYFVVTVYNPADTQPRIYVDGIEVGYSAGTQGAGTMASTANFTIGNFSQAGSAAAFQGKIDEVRLYNRALSIEEIKRLYLVGR